MAVGVHAVPASDGALRLEVRQEREMKPALLREREVAPHPVDRDAKQLGPVALKLRKDLVVQHHLVAAHRTPVGRIEREYHRPAAEVPQRDRLVRGAVQREVRCLGPGYEGTTGGASDRVRPATAPFVCREASRVLDRPKPDIYVRDSSYQIAHLQHKDASCVNTRVRVLVPVLMNSHTGVHTGCILVLKVSYLV